MAAGVEIVVAQGGDRTAESDHGGDRARVTHDVLVPWSAATEADPEVGLHRHVGKEERGPAAAGIGGEFREDAPCEDSRLLAAPEGLDVEAQLRGQGRGDESRESTVSPPRPRVECEKGVVATERVVAQPGERRLDPLRRQRRQVDRLEASLAQDGLESGTPVLWK